MHLSTRLNRGAAAALLLAAGVSAVPRLMTRDSVTCENNASNMTVYAATNAQFDILCGVDYAGGDMASQSVSTFEECITLCDSTPGCVNVAFAPWGMCWMKNQNTSPSPNSGIWTAKSRATPSGPTCADNFSDKKTYITPAGITFEIACGVDYTGGDMSSQNTNSFAQCIDLCGSTPGCVDVAYAAPSCYLKSALTSPQAVGHVWSAVRRDADADPMTCEDKEWDGREFTTDDDRIYSIGCGDDYPGGDMAAVDSATFEACLDACDAATGCVAVAYVAPRCYLKNVANPPAEGTHVWGAKFLRTYTPPAPSSTSTPTPTPTPPPPPPPPTRFTCNPCSPVLLNGGFDQGLTAWTPRDAVSSTFAAVPGPNGPILEVVSNRGHVALIQRLSTVAGATYTVNVDYMFSAYRPNCYLNAFLNGNWFWSFSPRYEPGSVGVYKRAELRFTASSCDMELGVQFVCTAGEWVTMYMDNLQFRGGPTCPA